MSATAQGQSDTFVADAIAELGQRMADHVESDSRQTERRESGGGGEGDLVVCAVVDDAGFVEALRDTFVGVVRAKILAVQDRPPSRDEIELSKSGFVPATAKEVVPR